MIRRIVGLLGLVATLGLAIPAQAAPQTGFDAGAVQQVQYYHHYHHRWHHWHHRHHAQLVVIAPR